MLVKVLQFLELLKSRAASIFGKGLVFSKKGLVRLNHASYQDGGSCRAVGGAAALPSPCHAVTGSTSEAVGVSLGASPSASMRRKSQNRISFINFLLLST